MSCPLEISKANLRREVERPLVSVIMNCYNGEKYLSEAIESVLAQTYRNWELIFWDNQSTDRSAEIFRRYSDSRLKYFYAPTHTLLYEGRNRAIARANGEFIAFLDVDDWWHPRKLESQLPLFDDPEVGFACSNYWIINENNKTSKLFRKTALPAGWVLNDLLANYPVGLLTLILRSEAFQRLQGGCDSRFHVIGDLDLVVRLALKWKMASCQEPMAFYRLHGNNEGQLQKERHVAEYEVWVRGLAEDPTISVLPGYGHVVNELSYMSARLHLAQGRKGNALDCMRSLPWGKFKVKLLILLIKANF